MIRFVVLKSNKCSALLLKNLILTRKGERILNPSFGCDIWQVLFEPIDGGFIENKIESTILDAVSNWLPYLNINEIVFDYDNNDIDIPQIPITMGL